jgi:nucleoid-associated protein YgaU
VTGEAASVPPSVEPAAAAVPPAMAGVQQSLPAPAQPAAAPAAGPAVMVEAVEIEGSMVFVAGSTEPGRRVRVYANSILLGDAVTSPQGRFLVEAMRDLPVGDYVIRVDVLDADGATVVARAAVPFEREPGETIAAVAPAPEIGIAGDTAAATQPAGEAPPANPPAPLAAAGVPAADAQSLAKAAPSSATLAAPALPEAPAAGNVPERAAPSPETPSTPSMGLSAAAGAPADRALEPALHPTVAEAPPTASAGDSGALPGAAVMPAAPGVDIAAASPAATDAPAPAGALEVTAPKLQSVNSAVIIRRGDSLWRISRRVYGRGTRYSTIYLANQAQIRDPDRIWPGQVFKVPDRSKEGEAADMSGMGGQATTLPEHARRAAQQ